MKLYPPTGGEPAEVSEAQADRLAESGWTRTPPKTTKTKAAAAAGEED